MSAYKWWGGIHGCENQNEALGINNLRAPIGPIYLASYRSVFTHD